MPPETAQPAAAASVEAEERMRIDTIPVVLDIYDMVRLLGMSRSQIDRQRRAHTFRFPEIQPPLDGRPRWLGEKVIQILRQSGTNGLRDQRRQQRKAFSVVHGTKVGVRGR